MSADDLEFSADLAEKERASIVAAHAARVRSPIPICQECDERHVHVTAKGLRWKYCAPCGEAITGVKA